MNLLRLSLLIKLLPLFAGLLLLQACKADDVFVAGGGPSPGFGSDGNNNGTRDSSSPTDSAPAASQVSTTDELVSDLTGTLLHVTGDTLLLTGGLIDSSSGLVGGLTDSGELPVDGVTGAVDGIAVSLTDDNLTAGVTDTVDGVTGGLTGGNELLGGVTGGLTGGNALLGGVTDTLSDVTGTSTGNLLDGVIGDISDGDADGSLLGSVTDTVDGVTGSLDDSTDGLLGNLLGSN